MTCTRCDMRGNNARASPVANVESRQAVFRSGGNFGARPDLRVVDP
jgi:hypothetical protein